MVTETPTKPLLLFNAFLDDGEVNLARKTVTFKEVAFSARVITFGTVDRSIPYPPGMMHSNDCTVELNDEDGQVRAWFDAITPLRRLGEIVFEFEYNEAITGSRNSPITPGYGYERIRPISDPMWQPLYRGEILGATFPLGRAIITLRDVFTKWLDRQIPKLITRDNFPDMPDEMESAFAPIILGRVESRTEVNVEKQGVILCPHIDTTDNLYCVARHSCYSVIAVYRKRKLATRFKLVSPSEYKILEVPYTIDGIIYNFTVIAFTVQQEDGAVIHADVSGFDSRFNFDTTAIVTGSEIRNPVDGLMNLIYSLLQDEIRIDRFNRQSFIELRAKFETMGWLCDGAITENLNQGLDQGVTTGQAISRLCSDFLVDFFMSNQGEITVKYFDPYPSTTWLGDWDNVTAYVINDVVFYGSSVYVAILGGTNHRPDISPTYWTVLTSDAIIPIDEDLTLKKTFEPGLPKPNKIFNRLRYRYCHQNAGLTEFISASKTGRWGYEETLDNAADQDEMLNTGQNPLLEEPVEMYFVRDDDTALASAKRKIGYYTLRSYPATFKVPAPEVVRYMQLCSPLSVTHFGGLAADGWVDEILKVVRLVFDLASYECEVEAIRYITVPESALIPSFTGTHPAHDVQTRIPAYPVLVNGSLDSGILVQDAEPQINLNDDYPLPPTELIEVVDVNIIYGFTSTGDPTSTTIDPELSGYVNVRFQEDQSSDPRRVSGYVPIPNYRNQVRYYTGTLNPDTRPTADMTTADIYKVIFYSTDFDHEYWWVGTSETGTPSGWLAIEQSAGNVIYRIAAPNATGYHLCDGSTNIRISDYKGDTSLITVPLVNAGTFIYGAAAYTGPAATAATAPGATSSSNGAHTHAGSTADGHTHAVGTLATNTTGSSHTHGTEVSTTVTDGGHSHTFTGVGGSGNTGAGGSHDHGGYTNNGTDDGAHEHSTASGPTEVAGLDIDVASHHHGLGSVVTGDSSAADTGGTDLSHTHSLGSLSGIISSESSEGDLSPESPIGASGVGDTVDISGSSTDSALGSHTHSMAHTHGMAVGSVTSNADGSAHIDQWAISVYVGNEDSEHKHVIASQATHTHTFSFTNGSGTTASTTTGISVSVGVTVNSTGSTHTHGVTGSTASSGATLTILSDGGHTHTITVDTAGLPKRMGLLPYIRL